MKCFEVGLNASAATRIGSGNRERDLHFDLFEVRVS
jgi:hypothetical protein